MTIPETLLTDCPIPEMQGNTYRDVAELAIRRRAALVDCNAQMDAARAYQKRIAKPD